MIDEVKLIDEWIEEMDWEVHENSNVNRSFQALVLYASGKLIREYVLNKVYPKEIREAHDKGYFHIHNLAHGLVPYCAGWSLRDLLLRGLENPHTSVRSLPAKHFDTALLHIVNFMGTMQLEFAGAQAFSSVDTYLAPFVWKDKLSYKEIKQGMQKLVFGLNIPSRWGSQTPFTNFTFDLIPPPDLKEQHAIVGGELIDKTYEEFAEEIELINRAFLEILLEGDGEHKPFTFPIPTYNLTKEFDWSSEIADLLFEVTAKFGSPYFQNYIGSDLDPRSIRAMCCRLQINLKELMIRGNALFGSGELTGSIGVVTINMNRIGYESKGDDDKFFEKLDSLMELAAKALEIKRKMLIRNLERGLLPYTRTYLPTKFVTHFSTIGLIGMNEALVNFMDVNILDKNGHQFAIRVLKFMREKLKEFQLRYGNLYNLEATPAEGASYRLALLDKKLCPGIYTAGRDEPYLTNSTWIPVDAQPIDVFDALEHQEPLQTLYTGGTTFRIFLGESAPPSSIKELVRKVATNSKIPYFDITPTFSICTNHGYFSGNIEKCPKCGKEMLVYSRVVGYFRPVKNWNRGKQEEFKDRRYFSKW